MAISTLNVILWDKKITAGTDVYKRQNLDTDDDGADTFVNNNNRGPRPNSSAGNNNNLNKVSIYL